MVLRANLSVAGGRFPTLDEPFPYPNLTETLRIAKVFSLISSTTEQSRAITASLVVLATVATAAALAYTRPVMVPFVLALFLSYLVSPLVNLFQDRFRVPRLVSIIIALLIAVGMLTLLGLLIITLHVVSMVSADIYR